MSKTLVQPIGQKRLTNVAVVRLKKHGIRFEIACYKNKVLSWRSGVEKDLDEVLQSQTVYSNVSKGILAKSKELTAAFGTDDQSKICLEILEKGELQVAGKERESQLSSQFRDIATIVMQKTINSETHRPYTINMIDRLMHEIHFAVDPNQNSKKQALEVIRELQNHFPIKRSPMRLRLLVPEKSFSTLMEKLSDWNANITSKDESGNEPSIEPDSVQLGEGLHKREISVGDSRGQEQARQNRCNTCDAALEDARRYREHFKSDWHKHNLKRKTRQLPPLTAEECLADLELGDSKGDLKEYSF